MCVFHMRIEEQWFELGRRDVYIASWKQGAKGEKMRNEKTQTGKVSSKMDSQHILTHYHPCTEDSLRMIIKVSFQST